MNQIILIPESLLPMGAHGWPIVTQRTHGEQIPLLTTLPAPAVPTAGGGTNMQNKVSVFSQGITV